MERNSGDSYRSKQIHGKINEMEREIRKINKWIGRRMRWAVNLQIGHSHVLWKMPQIESRSADSNVSPLFSSARPPELSLSSPLAPPLAFCPEVVRYSTEMPNNMHTRINTRSDGKNGPVRQKKQKHPIRLIRSSCSVSHCSDQVWRISTVLHPLQSAWL